MYVPFSQTASARGAYLTQWSNIYTTSFSYAINVQMAAMAGMLMVGTSGKLGYKKAILQLQLTQLPALTLIVTG